MNIDAHDSKNAVSNLTAASRLAGQAFCQSYDVTMADTKWYAEASLSSSAHVFCAGSLAQCVRKWTRLPEAQRADTQIKLAGKYEASEIVYSDQIALLARNPELARV